MNIAFLYTELSSYFLACLTALKKNEHKILLVYWPGSVQAPFQFDSLSWIDKVVRRDESNAVELMEAVTKFKADIIYLSGWADPAYVKVARMARKQSLIVVGIDNQWRGTLKQRIATLLSPLYLKAFIDVMWVAGSRQQELAKRFGFSGSKIWRGVYTCDWTKFSIGSARKLEERRNAFLFVGRYAEEKGIQALAEAYQLYRAEKNNPWDLIAVGTGPYQPEAWRHPSIHHIGFIQPDELPKVMSQCKAFILPSLYEPWGLVIHEAVTSGLPLICSDACGAADHFLKDGINGYLFPAGSVESLKWALIKMSDMSISEWTTMSEVSQEMSRKYTPEKWVETLISNGERMLKHGKSNSN